MHSEIRLVQAGAGMDMAARGYDDCTQAERDAVLAAHPRGYGFAHDVIDTFYEGLCARPDTTFGTFDDDFLAFKDPAFQRHDPVELALGGLTRAGTVCN
jgi:hypothetical protein